MRLIDADEFKKQIAGMAIINNYPADKANKICELIDLQKTAFDLDKVIGQIEELEREHPYKQHGQPDTYNSYNEAWSDCIDRVIGIVNEGGII